MNTIYNQPGMYSIEKIILSKELPNRPSYSIGAILTGPKGGAIAVDEFNLERLVINATGHRITIPVRAYITSYSNRTGLGHKVYQEYREDEVVQMLMKVYKIPKSRTLERIGNERLYNKISKDFYFYDPNFEECAMSIY